MESLWACVGVPRLSLEDPTTLLQAPEPPDQDLHVHLHALCIKYVEIISKFLETILKLVWKSLGVFGNVGSKDMNIGYDLDVFGIWVILGLFFGEAHRPFHSGGMVVLE